MKYSPQSPTENINLCCILQFLANTNISATNNTLQGTNVHFIRIHPVNRSGTFACLKLALFGCDTGGNVFVDTLHDNYVTFSKLD